MKSAGSVILVLLILMMGGCGLGAVGCCGVGGYFLYSSNVASNYVEPDRVEPDLPQALAGTLAELPIDTDLEDPAKPTMFASRDHESDEPMEELDIDTFPPGLDLEQLDNEAKSSTSASYQTKNESTPVNVHVVLTLNVNFSRQATQDVLRSTGGQSTPVRVQSNDGQQTYVGNRIQGPQNTTYILYSQITQTTVIVYAPSRTVDDVAARLAGNVGSNRGQFTRRYAQVTSTLPASTPAVLSLTETRFISPAELNNARQDLRSAAGADPELAEIFTTLEGFIPSQMVLASYRDGSANETGLVIGQYDSGSEAVQIFNTLRWTIGWGASGKTTISDSTALVFEDGMDRLIIFQKGPYLVIMINKSTSPESDLTDLGDALQI